MRKSRFTPQYALLLERLKDVRVSKGLLQADVAGLMGVPQQYVSRFETGETRMDVVQLWRYCRALNIRFSGLCKKLDGEFSAIGDG